MEVSNISLSRPRGCAVIICIHLSVSATSNFNYDQFHERMAFHKRTGSIPALHQTGYMVNPEAALAPAHHHHQVLYVCRGHCSGPECDFTQSLKQWHSTVWLGSEHPQAITQEGGAGAPGTVPGFQSQVVASAPKALEKLDQKRQTLHQLKEVLAQKLESKARHKKHKRERLLQLQTRPQSALPTSGSGSASAASKIATASASSSLALQKRPASAMVVRSSTPASTSIKQQQNSSSRTGKKRPPFDLVFGEAALCV